MDRMCAASDSLKELPLGPFDSLTSLGFSLQQSETAVGAQSTG